MDREPIGQCHKVYCLKLVAIHELTVPNLSSGIEPEDMNRSASSRLKMFTAFAIAARMEPY